jgi:hypothetical protein
LHNKNPQVSQTEAATQRSAVAVELANLTNGQKTSSANLQSTAVTQAEAATLQRSAIAAELANMRLGDNQHVGSANLQTQVSQTEAATLLNVSPRAVTTAAFRHGVAG